MQTDFDGKGISPAKKSDFYIFPSQIFFNVLFSKSG